MFTMNLCQFTLLALFFCAGSVSAYFRDIECGPYGFVCEGKSKLRLCDGDKPSFGPTFLCPAGTICNEDSSDVCENLINYMDPAIRSIKCRRNERIADHSVPDCKGYILCIPNKNKFQGIKLQCTGNTLFNGFTRTCSSPERYKCPLNTTRSSVDLFQEGKDNMGYKRYGFGQSPIHSSQTTRTIDCKNYKLTVTQEKSPTRATYFCPSRPVNNGESIKCTVFSNNFCIILERDDEDQFLRDAGAASRRPRKNDVLDAKLFNGNIVN